MTPLCEKVIRDYQIRKSGKQKKAFREDIKAELREKGIFMREERTKEMVANSNLIAGNIHSAEFVLSAHYDTCAVLPFPNLVAPLNWVISILFQFWIPAVIFAVAFAVAAISRLFGASPHLVSVIFRVIFVAAFVLMIAGPANRHTMNDNTSGVVVLLTLLERMTPAQRRRVAIVLFDNEEIGSVGSSVFRKRHKTVMEKKPLINLDCVGDGRHMLFAATKAYRADEALYARTQQAFQGEFEALHVSAARAFYPSDQFGYKKSLAVAAFHKKKFVGYVLGRIHTRRDVVLDEGNVEYLVEGLLRLIGNEDE